MRRIELERGGLLFIDQHVTGRKGGLTTRGSSEARFTRF